MLRLGRLFFNQLKAKEKQQRISQLKKSSGYSLGQCRKALEENDYDIDMANEYSKFLKTGLKSAFKFIYFEILLLFSRRS